MSLLDIELLFVILYIITVHHNANIFSVEIKEFKLVTS